MGLPLLQVWYYHYFKYGTIITSSMGEGLAARHTWNWVHQSRSDEIRKYFHSPQPALLSPTKEFEESKPSYILHNFPTTLLIHVLLNPRTHTTPNSWLLQEQVLFNLLQATRCEGKVKLGHNTPGHRTSMSETAWFRDHINPEIWPSRLGNGWGKQYRSSIQPPVNESQPAFIPFFSPLSFSRPFFFVSLLHSDYLQPRQI